MLRIWIVSRITCIIFPFQNCETEWLPITIYINLLPESIEYVIN